ncbi:radical SAM protein [Candidatus Woesearchaeota archaeon]|nr:radical SAM protein [Candidatus Woesearchaeota archaeon]
MAELHFEDLSFEDAGDFIKATFLKMFYFLIPQERAQSIGEYSAKGNSITFTGASQKSAERKFSQLLEEGFRNLRNRLNDKPSMYIHKNSGIPLVGNVGWGIIDRDTSMIELKPISSCNIKCIFCSVDEDQRNKDVVIEESYLVEEMKKVVEQKDCGRIEVMITSQGEPTLYAPLPELIGDLKKIPQVKIISLVTNGVLLNKEYADRLIGSGLDRFNVSINAISQEMADKLAGCHYPIKRVMEICSSISLSGKAKVMINPVYVPGMNEAEMEKIVDFAESINADVGIQNFLPYRFGRNPVKGVEMEEFFEKMERWQEKAKIKLLKTKEDFTIIPTKPLPKPFKKGDIVRAELKMPGRFRNEMIAVAEGRTISVLGCSGIENRDIEDGGKVDGSSGGRISGKSRGGIRGKIGQKIRVKITRSKHNIYLGVVA